ncbi:MAG: NAD(P)-dependent oxidoreductase [Caldilineaceae bacterium]
MRSAIVVHPNFDHAWPWVADQMQRLWQQQGPVDFVRLPYGEVPAVHTVLEQPAQIARLVCFGAPLTAASLAVLTGLREVAVHLDTTDPLTTQLAAAGVQLIWQQSEGYWGQSVAEFALGLTIGALRRIPQTHHNILTDLRDWDYRQPDGVGRPSQRGIQFGDDDHFTNGTIAGKRVRIVGAGNIGSRYASFCHFLGADVAVWDPFAPEPSFHRAGARREHFLERLVADAEIFAPMVPLTPQTAGLIKADQIRALPTGCLVVTATRAKICDTAVLYERVLNDELALAADVFDHEPLELGHPLLGRPNVVHTPHNAGRTKDANFQFAQMLADQFRPR